MPQGLQSIAIVGGGIAGLSCALAVAKAGLKATVYERQVGLESEGAGIQITPNASRLLFQLGLKEDLLNVSSFPKTMVWMDGSDDSELARFQLGKTIERRFGAPYLHVYRPELIECLSNAMTSLNGVSVHYNSPVKHVTTANDGVVLDLGSTSDRADLCIAADGTNSAIVSGLMNDQPLARKSVGTAYRIILAQDDVSQQYFNGMLYVWLHSGFHVVVYPVKRGKLLNCVFVVRDLTTDSSEVDLHRQKAEHGELAERLDVASANLKELVEIGETRDIHKWPIFTFQPFDFAHRFNSRVAFVGDAWHTTLPYAAQGASLGIEDAVVLGNLLEKMTTHHPRDLLLEFETQRIKRLNQVQSISNRNDTIYHLKGKISRRLVSLLAPIGFKHISNLLFGFIP